MNAIDLAKREYVLGYMTLDEFEAVTENYLRGGDWCAACGRFPVDADDLCDLHRV